MIAEIVLRLRPWKVPEGTDIGEPFDYGFDLFVLTRGALHVYVDADECAPTASDRLALANNGEDDATIGGGGNGTPLLRKRTDSEASAASEGSGAGPDEAVGTPGNRSP